MANAAKKTGSLFARYAGTATTDASGVATFTFPTGLFSAPPILAPASFADGATASIVAGSVTATAAKIKVKRATDLVALANSPVNLIAIPATG